MGMRCVVLVGLLSGLFCGSASAQTAKAGALYSLENGDGRYTVAKVLKVEPYGVHVRLYANKFQARPEKVDPASLSLGTVHDKDPGIGHLPVTHKQFQAWHPVFVTDSPVAEDELEGYREWRSAGGRFWGSK